MGKLASVLLGGWGWLGLLIGLTGISVIGLPDLWIQNLVNVGFWTGEQGGGLGVIAAAFDGDQTLAVLGQLWDSGEWWMFLAAIAMASGTVMMRPVSRHADPLVATGFHMILGGLPLFALSAGWEVNQWDYLTGSDWLALGYSTVFGGAIAYGLFFYLAAKGNLTSLSSLAFLTPVFALIFGGLLLSEALTLVQSVGVFLTLISVLLVNQRERLKAWLTPENSSPTLQKPQGASQSSAD